MSDAKTNPPDPDRSSETAGGSGPEKTPRLVAASASQPAPKDKAKPAPKADAAPAAPAEATPAPAAPQPPKAKPAQPGKNAGPKPAAPTRPVARPARFRSRHWGLALSFLLIVVVPVAASSWYLFTRAADQYASTLAFTVRSEDVSSAVDILGGLSSSLGVGGSATSRDTDILYEFIRSQEIVETLDGKLDLEEKYSEHVGTDPVFGYEPGGTIEDLTDYWQRMVRVSYDAASGLMELQVLAFTPEDAKLIAESIYEESSRMINQLSAIAQEDATSYAREDLERAVERLKESREALTAFRVENQIVDVTADIQGQMGLLNTLQAQLAEALIDLDLLSNTARSDDPRLTQAQRRIEVIEARIEEERQKFGAGSGEPGDDSYATTVAEFERLSVDREFAEQAYLAALSAYDGAVAEANRQSRYLAAYIRPTLAQKSEFPQTAQLIGLTALFAFLIWAILGLVYYALRDRR